MIGSLQRDVVPDSPRAHAPEPHIAVAIVLTASHPLTSPPTTYHPPPTDDPPTHLPPTYHPSTYHPSTHPFPPIQARIFSPPLAEVGFFTTTLRLELDSANLDYCETVQVDSIHSTAGLFVSTRSFHVGLFMYSTAAVHVNSIVLLWGCSCQLDSFYGGPVRVNSSCR